MAASTPAPTSGPCRCRRRTCRAGAFGMLREPALPSLNNLAVDDIRWPASGANACAACSARRTDPALAGAIADWVDGDGHADRRGRKMKPPEPGPAVPCRQPAAGPCVRTAPVRGVGGEVMRAWCRKLPLPGNRPSSTRPALPCWWLDTRITGAGRARAPRWPGALERRRWRTGGMGRQGVDLATAALGVASSYFLPAPTSSSVSGHFRWRASSAAGRRCRRRRACADAQSRCRRRCRPGEPAVRSRLERRALSAAATTTPPDRDPPCCGCA